MGLGQVVLDELLEQWAAVPTVIPPGITWGRPRPWCGQDSNL